MARSTKATEANRLTTARVAQKAGAAAKAELVARGDALVNKALALKDRIARDFWQLGRVLVTMRDEGVHAALGFDSFEALASQRLGIAKTTAWKLMAVAEQLPRAKAIALGVEKAHALIAYAKATPEDDSARGLAAADATIGGRRLSQASVREVGDAAAQRRPKRPPTFAEAAQDKADRELLARVTNHLAGARVPRSAVSLVGERVRIELTRRQVARMLAGS